MSTRAERGRCKAVATACLCQPQPPKRTTITPKKVSACTQNCMQHKARAVRLYLPAHGSNSLPPGLQGGVAVPHDAPQGLHCLPGALSSLPCDAMSLDVRAQARSCTLSFCSGPALALSPRLTVTSWRSQQPLNTLLDVRAWAHPYTGYALPCKVCSLPFETATPPLWSYLL